MDERDQIKERVDVAELIGEYVPLKKAGTNFKGLCPFHNEKSPSFMVSPDKQIWHCFGCGKGGDAFSFLMEKEGMDFPEALRTLAKRTGIQLKPRNPKIWTRKNKLFEISNLASRYFSKAFLESREAEIARQHIAKRKFTPEILKEFQVGYSPDSWDIVSKFLRSKEYIDEDIFAAGLTVKKDNGGYYDRFRGRLMFPIKNLHGDVVAFGARTLKNEDAKYINTQETEIYQKSWVMYGLYDARGEIRKKDLAIIVEGYTDVMASHQVGITNVVASSGTALTEGHLRLLKRYTKKLTLAFDMDLAGDMATKRGISLALAEGFDVSVVRLPAGKDPADLAIEDAKAWQQAIKTRQPIMEYFFDSAFTGKDVNNVEDKKTITRELLPVIKKIENEVERHHYLQSLAGKLSVPEETLREALEKTRLKRVQPTPKSENKAGQKEQDLLAKRFLGLALKMPDEMEYVLDHFDKEFLPSEELRKLYIKLETFYNTNRSYTAKQFAQSLSTESNLQTDLVPQLLLYIEKDFATVDPETMSQELKTCVSLLRRDFLKSQLRKISEQLASAEKESQSSQVAELSTKFTRLSGELRDAEKQLNRE
ncbi:DNA primase [Patescibacteria group bacterium]